MPSVRHLMRFIRASESLRASVKAGRLPCCVYLSSSGSLTYMGPDAPQVFREHGIELTWSRHEHLTGDSVVTLLLDEEDPMPAILHEHEG